MFLGNSYTYVNNLPQLIHDIALANSDTLVFDSNCPGGHTLQNHYNNTTSIAKINSNAWDYVVLQAQSQEPSFPPNQVNSQTLPYAIKLDSLIKMNNLCSKTVFYETWGRKFGDASNCSAYPPVCTYIGMQDRLKESYKLFADTTHGVMACVGEAFRKSISLNPTLELYQSDQSHPSLDGSYLAACVFYETLFHKSVLNNSFTASLSNASFLQQVAHDVVRDSLNSWNLGINDVWAPFDFANLINNSFQFSSPSTIGNHFWDFGDGGSDTQTNPTHTYANSGVYSVTHTINDNCITETYSITLNTQLIGIAAEPNNPTVSIFPNPATNSLNINSKSPFRFNIYNITGEIILSGTASSKIDISELKSGQYFISINHLIFKFIKLP